MLTVQPHVSARRTDWRLATFDETTASGTDPAATIVELIDAAVVLLAARGALRDRELATQLRSLRRQLREHYDDRHLDDFMAELPPERAAYATEVLHEAIKRLP
jgi:hypothetical protein